MASEVRASKKTSRTKKFSLGDMQGHLCGATGLETAGKLIPSPGDPDLRPLCAGELLTSDSQRELGPPGLALWLFSLYFSEKGFRIAQAGLELPLYLRRKTYKWA